MRNFIGFLQIRDLFTGNFTWHGLLLLLLFALMALIAAGFTIFVAYKAFQPKSEKKAEP